MRVRLTLVGLGILTVAAATVALIWLVPPLLYPAEPEARSQASAQVQSARLQAVATTRAAFVAGLAGLAALAGLWINSLQNRIAQRTLEQAARAQEADRRAQTEALNLQTEALITDRYSKAIEQLATPDSDAIAVRLGAIYSSNVSREAQRQINLVWFRCCRHSSYRQGEGLSILARQDWTRIGRRSKPSQPPG